MVFEQWQGKYAEHGIITFPVKADQKKPAVIGFLKIGPKASAAWASRPQFAQDAIGFSPGKRNGITVLDVDTTDGGVLEEALRRHGDTPIVIRTASGKAHAWYQYNGESRRIRPWKGLPIDVLGDRDGVRNSFVVAPPSRRSAGGEYHFLHGDLSEIVNLPTMRDVDDLKRPAKVTKGARADEHRTGKIIQDGWRNDWMINQCQRAARHCDNLDALLDVARTRNQECNPPLEEEKLMAIASWAWNLQANGLNRVGQGHGAWFPVAEIISLVQDQDAFVLLAFLRANEGPNATFWVANGLSERFGWDRRRFSAARRRLLELDYIVQIQKPHQGSNALYRWA
jgi:Bifunctional DNA primase/polymerase, N-terminal/Primase C terminal 1 (PriCT-1)